MDRANDLSPVLEAASAHSKDRLELWATIINELKVETMLELGVWKGDFAAHILAHCPSIKRYYMLDPWRPLPSWNKPLNVGAGLLEEAYQTALAATSFAKDKITILRGTTTEVITQIPDASLDLAYIDGDHTLRGITLDLLNATPKVRAGGTIAGDDFVQSVWQHSSRYEPTLVFPFALYFAEANKMPAFALTYSQFLLVKSTGHYRFTDLTGDYSAHDLLHHFHLPRMIRRSVGELLRRAAGNLRLHN